MGVDMDLFTAAFAARRQKWIGFTIAVFGPLAGLFLRLALGALLTGFPFISFFPGILCATLFGGRRAGALASVISAVLCGYFLIPPVHRLLLPWPGGYVAMLFFGVVACALILLIDEAMVAGVRLIEARDMLKRMNEALESRVAERTHDLTLLNARLEEEILTKERAETQVRQMQKIEALGQLTGGIAHDFNNMLAIIMGSLEMANRRLENGRGNIGDLLNNAMEGARRAAALTHQLLAFSRQQPLAPEVADINGVVAHMAEILRRTLGEGVNLECVLAGGVWRTRVDTGQLENALLNLAVNARDAMPAGGRLTIETQNARLDDEYAAAQTEAAPGQYVLIAVTDTGTGMAPDIAARAFDPFFTTKEKGRGTGLGLSQVHGFIKQSGGHIKIYSEVAHGTSVKIYLPRFTGDAAAEIAACAEPAAPSGSPSEIVLLVEDDEAVRDVHVNMLRGLNYTVRHANDGGQALEILREQPGIKLLFTDVVMPGMSGRELAGHARQIAPDLKVLLTTGYTANAIVHNGIIDAGVDLLQKPFSYDMLARKVRMALDRA
jgi:signal transduction histidine kinase/CheY-like chemotaxis protein